MTDENNQLRLQLAQTQLKLIEAQMQVLQYQHRDVSEALKKRADGEAQKQFDAAVDAHDTAQPGIPE